MSSSSSVNEYDVCILGGGLASLTLAIQLIQETPTLKILVLEKDRHPAPDAAFKVGESSVEISGHYFGEVLGLKEHIETAQLPKLGLRFFFRRKDSTSLSDGIELGGSSFWPTPSYQFDRGIFETFLAKRVTELGGAFVDGARVVDVQLRVDEPHQITFRCADKTQSILAKWVVDGSGRAALLKRKLGLKEEVRHKANAAWFRVDQRIEIDEWLSDRKTSDLASDHGPRWLSTNHLMGPGYWVWLIPLSSGSTSVGIVADDRIQNLREYNSIEKALAWIQRNEPVLFEHLSRTKPEIQDFKVLKHYSHSASQVYSNQRWAITGEAGVFTDPFYSPGSDFIAISNTFVADLIRRDHRGERFGAYTEVYDELFRSVALETFRVFEDQYCMWGNPRVMPLKIIWDFSFYWCGLASLFFHGLLRDLNSFLLVKKLFREMSLLSADMQVVFRSWHQALEREQREYSKFQGAYLNFTQISHLYQLNQKLRNPVGKTELVTLFRENLELLRALAAEMVHEALEDVPDLEIPRSVEVRDAHTPILGCILSELPQVAATASPPIRAPLSANLINPA